MTKRQERANNITVSADIPDPEDVIDDLLEFVPLAYAAIEAGSTEARSFFDDRGDEYESYLFSDIVRYGAKKHFERHRRKVELEIIDLANNGLLLSHNGYPIRIRKAYRYGVAVPGSFAMEQFHAQSFNLLNEVSGKANLFVLWDVYKPSFTLAPDLYVACPKRNTARFPDSADLHWMWKLPNVALLPGAPVEADGFDDYEDLPIRKSGEETGTGTEDR